MSVTYFIGIKGVGMTALALAMAENGATVQGADTSEVFITDHILAEYGIPVFPLPAKIPEDTTLIIYSGAFTPPPSDVRTITLAEALAEFVSLRKVIAVAGVGGKTTTCAMLATMFRAGGHGVGYYIGTSDIVGLSAPGACGTSPYFIVEADEYAISKNDPRPKFALITPHILITTNIRHDHPDIYPTPEDTLVTFRTLIERLPKNSLWIACEDDPLTQELLRGPSPKCKIIRYGVAHPLYSKLRLSVFGNHNQLNAVATVIAGIESGLSEQKACLAVKSYRGATRRQESHGEVEGRLLYDDYGHHPHEIVSTIRAFREAFPSRRLLVVFEAHTYTRTQSLFVDFAKALALSDLIFIMPIFESAREKGQLHTVTPASFAEEIAKLNSSVKVVTWENATSEIWSKSRPNDLILTMGAGFVYKLHSLWTIPKLRFAVSLSEHTYFHLGGPADFYLEANDTTTLCQAIEGSIAAHTPYLVLGSGSNVLVGDAGYRGLVIIDRTRQIKVLGNEITADGGTPISLVINKAIAHGLAGLESFLGLPGTVGGAIYNNSHHLKSLIGDYVKEVTVFTSSGEKKTYTQAQLDFAYDYSRLHNSHDTVLTATFSLKSGDKENLKKQASVAVAHRAKTQPLGVPSSGCIFQNVDDQSVGKLIDEAGLKGARVGGAYVSHVHANFIVNDGSAKTRDVLALIKHIQEVILAKYDITLKPEVMIIGE